MHTKTLNESFAKLYGNVNDSLIESPVKPPKKDLSKVAGSMTKVMSDNMAMLKNTESPTQLAKVLENLFLEYDINTPASNRLIKNVASKRDWLSAFYAITNSILDGSGLGVVSTTEGLDEAANPENEEANKLIRDIANGDSRAYSKLRKLGYEVDVDDSARKQFGSDYFGRRIDIVNTKTGRKITADPGHKWRGEDSVIARPVTDTSVKNPDQFHRNFHVIKPGKYAAKGRNQADAQAFDYKGYLDKPIYDDSQEPTTLDQFKADKKYVRDNEFTLKRGKEAEQRMDAVRARLGKRSTEESLNSKKRSFIKESADDYENNRLVLMLLKEYDEIVEVDYSFEESLNDFLDTITIYHSDNYKWFNADTDLIFDLGMQWCEEADSYTHDFDDFVRGALTNLVYQYIPSKFEEVYNKHKELDD